ncbi:tripartite tricarboxylate transporter TctA family protein [Scopulibacillus darangshiensis]|uniref:Tripartite tricarboxylate transporter TctA family protein n=1 Tax=Scopulibacillus darangshiensis TaxID=442528 RepID=A0A4R2NZS1_9BACL|nr:tripartite tricarboxylate transporter permease [Scopulibacillus darangshiensis]TCP27839.1 tripartite tricarboxylate transporter TctA family protein [Scopulibacillus darangshiensis]
MSTLLISILLAIVGGVLFSLIGLVSGSDETATMVPFTLLVILLGAPPVAVFSFFMAAIISKHLTHAAPTALMGIPGDTMMVPLLDHTETLRKLGVPHIALRKMISGGIIGAFIAFPVALVFAQFLGEFSDFFKAYTGVIFAVASLVIAYFSKGKWVSILLVIPFALFIQGLNLVSFEVLEKHLAISFFLGIAIGPMFSDILIALSSSARKDVIRSEPQEYNLAPEIKSWSGYFPNPLRILTRSQKWFTSGSAFITSFTFTFSPTGMTALMGELVGSRIRGLYKRSTTTLSVMNGVTESTYIAETIIPLVAFGIPLSPMALGPAAPLFNAPPVFSVKENLHHLMSSWDFLIFGAIGLIVGAVIAYPFVMNYSRKATVFIMKYISQEAIIGMFIAIVCVIAYYEGQITGILVTFTVASVGGLLNRILGVGSGAQFMIYYGSAWIMSQVIGL